MVLFYFWLWFRFGILIFFLKFFGMLCFCILSVLLVFIFFLFIIIFVIWFFRWFIMLLVLKWVFLWRSFCFGCFLLWEVSVLMSCSRILFGLSVGRLWIGVGIWIILLCWKCLSGFGLGRGCKLRMSIIGWGWVWWGSSRGVGCLIGLSVLGEIRRWSGLCFDVDMDWDGYDMKGGVFI